VRCQQLTFASVSSSSFIRLRTLFMYSVMKRKNNDFLQSVCFAQCIYVYTLFLCESEIKRDETRRNETKREKKRERGAPEKAPLALRSRITNADEVCKSRGKKTTINFKFYWTYILVLHSTLILSVCIYQHASVGM
jgi:Ca2+/Na+ antiporter